MYNIDGVTSEGNTDSGFKQNETKCLITRML